MFFFSRLSRFYYLRAGQTLRLYGNKPGLEDRRQESDVAIFYLKNNDGLRGGYIAYHPRKLPSIEEGVLCGKQPKPKEPWKLLTVEESTKISQLRLSNPSFYSISVLSKLFKIPKAQVARIQPIGGKTISEEDERKVLKNATRKEKRQLYLKKFNSVQRRVERAKPLLDNTRESQN
jgi:hypothetical protein